MTMHARFSSRSATVAVLVAAGVSALALGAQSATGRAVAAQTPAHAAKSGACHITQTRSIGSPTPVKIVFANHEAGPVGVYWLNYTGFLVYYESIAPHASVTQSTFRSAAWVMLNSRFNCVGYVVTGTAPRYVIR